MQRFDIAILLGYPEISGGTNVILEHALGLTRLGHSVSIVTERPFDPQRLAWKPEAQKLPLLSHADCRQRVFDLSIATWWRSVFDLPYVPARWYAYFCQSIESRFFDAADADLQALVDYTYRQPLAVVTEASWIARYLSEHYGRQTTLVRNGIDKLAFRADGPAVEPRPAPGLRVLVEGALSVPFKRVEMTIALCRQAGIDDVWLLTPTPCTDYPGVRRVCSQIPMPRVGEVYRSCDVLVKLSTVEGMFGPPLEMMHCGGTAITSDVTGHDEYMRHGENGLVVRRGEESEVIKYLRALRADRALLDRLKEGARRTAAAWPDWLQAVQEMERFVLSICGREPTAELVQHQMLHHLQAALRLAGPLQHAVRPEHSGTQLLKMALGKLRQKIKRKLGRAAPAPTAAETPAATIEPVPEFACDRPLEPKPRYRICFVGDERRYAAHVPAHAARAETHFVDAGRGLTDEHLGQIAAFGPDFTIVVDPAAVPEPWLAGLPGFVLGYDVAALTPERLAALRTRFPHAARARRALLHMDANAVPALLAGGIYTPGAFLLPTDAQEFNAEPDAADWQRREIDLLYVGPVTATSAPFLAVLAHLPGFLHIPGPAADRTLRGVLARTKMVLHLPAPDDAQLDAAKAVRDSMCGALVLARRFAVDYGLIPGEHYLFCDTPEQLVALVQQQLTRPDELDLVRRRAWEHVRRYDANETWVPTLERYCCGVPDGMDWAGHVVGATPGGRVGWPGR